MPGKLIMTKGLSASGKSTWAREQVEKGQGNVKRVCKDDLRAMLDNGAHSDGREKAVLAARDTLVGTFLALGHTVIVDDTNLAPKHEQRLWEIARAHNVAFEVKDFTHVSVEECLKRDRKRSNYVGEQVILKQYNDYLAPKAEPPTHDMSKHDCVIVDLDGTLADISHRSPYDASTCEDDILRHHVAQAVHAYRAWHQVFVILVSGRNEKYRAETERWLAKHGIVYHSLHMRPDEDGRKDYVFKEEVYLNEIKPTFNVLGVWDDRPSVIRNCWRKHGLPVFNCGDGIEF